MEVWNNVKSYLQKYEILINILKKYEYIGVAFSGGVDSTLLLKASVDALGDNVVAATSTSLIHSRREIEAASAYVATLCIPHVICDPGMMDDASFIENTPMRCYHCKRRMFIKMSKEVELFGVSHLVHGVNCDDLSDYRPGLQAAEELGISAPMVEAGLFKADIRALAETFGLSVANKPAMSCLATRISYGEPITPEALAQVEASEMALYDLGFEQFRVRHHGIVARIEFSLADLKRLFDEDLMGRVVAGVRGAGYLHVAADLEGYGQGRMNRVLEV